MVTQNFQSKRKAGVGAALALTLLFSLCLFAAKPAWGQASSGITGTVLDQSGAVIPDAHVTITDE